MISARSAFKRPVVQSASRSGSVSPAISADRIRPAAGAQDVADHARQLHVRVFERLLHAQGVPCDLTHQLLAGSRQVAQRLDRGRRHEAAFNQPVRQQVGDPRRVLPVALAAWNVADVLRVGEQQLERLCVFEDVPHRLPVHAGRLHRHVRAAGLGQPRRQLEQPRRCGRKLLMLGRGLPTGGDAHARVHAPRVDIQPGAPGIHDLHPSPPVSRSAGVESASTESGRRAYRPEPVSQYGVLAGLRVKLRYGLCRTNAGPTSVPASRATLYPVSFMRGSGTAGWRTTLRPSG